MSAPYWRVVLGAFWIRRPSSSDRAVWFAMGGRKGTTVPIALARLPAQPQRRPWNDEGIDTATTFRLMSYLVEA